MSEVPFSTWSQVALEYFSRSKVLAIAEAQERRERVEARLGRVGTYELAVRIARFFGNALMVIGIAFLVLPSLLSPVTSSGRPVSVGAHLGGMATGMLIGAAISSRLIPREPEPIEEP